MLNKKKNKTLVTDFLLCCPTSRDFEICRESLLLKIFKLSVPESNHDNARDNGIAGFFYGMVWQQ